jgi:CHASE3 domain sensor protein
MEALALFFVFCITCMLFVVMMIMVFALYWALKAGRTVKRYVRPAQRVLDEFFYIWKG